MIKARREDAEPVAGLHTTDVSEIHSEPSGDVPPIRSDTEISERASVSLVCNLMLCVVDVTRFTFEALPNDAGTSYESTCDIVPG